MIYPIENEYKASTFLILRTFTRTINKEQLTIFMRGFAISCYFLELSRNIFTKGNKEINKILNQFEKESQVLLSWINEPNQEKMDAEMLKNSVKV